MSINIYISRFVYDESSPTCLRYRVDVLNSKGQVCSNARAGSVAGSVSSDPKYHARVGVNGKHVLCHRIIWEMFNGPVPDGMFVDHFDQDRQNNKISNLRLVTRSENNSNKGKYENNTSGVNGVYTLTHKGHTHWCATWYTIEHRKNNKWFSVSKYGYDEAFRLACEYRAKMIEELNRQGAGYTERHGT